MKEKGIKYNSNTIYGFNKVLGSILQNINPAKDHIGYYTNIASVIGKDSRPIFENKLYEHRLSKNKQGESVNKIDGYVGSGWQDPNTSILSINFNEAFKLSEYHHIPIGTNISSILQGI